MTTKPPKPFEMGAPNPPHKKNLETVEREQYATLLAMAVEIRKMPDFTSHGSPAQALLRDMKNAVFSAS